MLQIRRQARHTVCQPLGEQPAVRLRRGCIWAGPPGEILEHARAGRRLLRLRQTIVAGAGLRLALTHKPA